MPKSTSRSTSDLFSKKTLKPCRGAERVEYLNRKLRGIVRTPTRIPSPFRSICDSAGLKARRIKTIKDLEKLPITKKADLVELQKKTSSLWRVRGSSPSRAEKDLRLSRSDPRTGRKRIRRTRLGAGDGCRRISTRRYRDQYLQLPHGPLCHAHDGQLPLEGRVVSPFQRASAIRNNRSIF